MPFYYNVNLYSNILLCSGTLSNAFKTIIIKFVCLSAYYSLHSLPPVFGISDKARFKSFTSATETSYKIEISPLASLHMSLSKKRITKALIRLRGCAGWSVPVFFPNPRRQFFSRCGPYNIEHKLYLLGFARPLIPETMLTVCKYDIKG